MIIGLTGLSGAGKNHVAKILAQWGLDILDVDTLGHRATELEKEKIIDSFGRDILDGQGNIDRRILGSIVANSPEKLNRLEEIIHPRARALVQDWIKSQSNKNLVINAALLHESGLEDQLSFILLIQAPLILRALRIRRRDKLPFKLIFSRFYAQRNFFAQYFSLHTDIYRVKNWAFPGFSRKAQEKRLKKRLKTILQAEGMAE